MINFTGKICFQSLMEVRGNDILHTDNAKRTTTSGTSQDTDGMWYENYLTAKDVMIKVLEKLITVADVHFLFCPSNRPAPDSPALSSTFSVSVPAPPRPAPPAWRSVI